MRISKMFNLNRTQWELDFVDIDINKDIPLFIDPYFLSHCQGAWANDASRTLRHFFQVLIDSIRLQDHDTARSMFLNLHEPNETCLGMSRKRPQGRGVGDMDSKKIFESVLKSKAVATGIVDDLEDFRIFVDGVDKDKLSDMATNIIRHHLLSYTQRQCNLWGIPLQSGVPTGYYWNRRTAKWENEYSDYLVIKERKILLTPKRIVSFSKDYTPQKYVQHFVLNFLKNEHLRLNSALVQVRRNKKGEVVRKFVTKKSIREEEEEFTKEYLADFSERHPEVFKDFKIKTKGKLRTITNAELSIDSLDDILTYLKEKLMSIAPGNEEATNYHRLCAGILELLFYPFLCSPTIEQEIHDGRKRIDIVFDNSAETGFFYRLPNTHGIPSSFIFIECKNYSRDINNPELDQISGRFNPNRGKCGIILCRAINDFETFLRRCSDTYHDDRGLIIPLVDADLISLLDGFAQNGNSVWENLLQERFRQIALQ